MLALAEQLATAITGIPEGADCQGRRQQLVKLLVEFGNHCKGKEIKASFEDHRQALVREIDRHGWQKTRDKGKGFFQGLVEDTLSRTFDWRVYDATWKSLRLTGAQWRMLEVAANTNGEFELAAVAERVSARNCEKLGYGKYDDDSWSFRSNTLGLLRVTFGRGPRSKKE